MEHSDSAAAEGARDVIAHLQQSVHALLDGDRVLPADGASLLAALDRALAVPHGESAAAARAAIEAFNDWVQALVEAEALEAADGRPRIEAAAALGTLLRGPDGTDLEPSLTREREE